MSTQQTAPEVRITPQPASVAAMVVLSLLGSLFHNVMEFGWASFAATETFFVPWVVILALLFAVWWRAEQLRTSMRSLLPFGFLPFDPEQSLHHYFAHTIYGVAQVPLFVLLLWPYMPKRR